MLGKNLKQLTDRFSKLESTRKRAVLNYNRPNSVISTDASPELIRIATELEYAEAIQRNNEIENLKVAAYTPPICDYIDSMIIDPESVNTATWNFARARGVKLEPFQRRILTHVFTPDPVTGLFPYRTIVWSAPKKSGKTATISFVGAWFAEFIEPPNLVLVAANTQGQATGRIFNSMLPTLKYRGARNTKVQIELQNGTYIQSITNDPASNAGASYGLVLISELWGWDGERAKTLWAETKPVPTRLNSMRIVETYVGYEDKSEQLLLIWKNFFTDTSETELAPGCEPVPGLEDIQTVNQKRESMPCCYRVPDTGMFMFIDHSHRMPWLQGEKGKKYYAEATVGDTEADVLRLVYNYWQKTENPFIKEDMLLNAVARGKDAKLTADGLSVFGKSFPRRVDYGKKLTLAIDASQGRIDTTAIAGVWSERDEDTMFEGVRVAGPTRFNCAYFKAYYPDGTDFDLDDLIGKDVVRLWKAGLIKRRDPDPKEMKLIKENTRLIPIAVFYDPMQMHQVAVNLKNGHNLLIKEFSQQTDRVRADTFLYSTFKNGLIAIPDDTHLKEHLTAARAEHQKTDVVDARIRIVKPVTAHHAIDGAVALSMATYAESLTPPPKRRHFGTLAMESTRTL